MRKLLLTAVGAVAVATASMASAAVTVTASSGLSAPNGDPFANPSLVINYADGSSTVQYGIQPVPNPTFNASFTFTNTIAGVYNVVLQTSTTGVVFTSGALTGGSCAPAFCTLGGLPGTNLALPAPVYLAAATYTFAFGGNNSSTSLASTLNGNVTITPAVPEPAAWAMMLIGFGGIGLAMRRRRRPALAQIA
ncbi:MAG: PEP-CTERM sorting domain-containing protein [Sphingomonas sp.]|nr:PEP-CTERM sorting domain-containing protein [Sphingomonas sp.]MBW0006491.1 PEP-CTERM sorting domain-containing protein [Sphingomonas sp.]